MRTHEVAGLAAGEVLPALRSWSARERRASAVVVALIARADAEKLYAPAGYPSMYAFCVHALLLSEHEAYMRIEVARKALEFPAVFSALEEDRLTLTAVLLLAPHLSSETKAQDLIAAATHKTKAEIRLLLAERFPRSEFMPLVQALHAPDQLGLDRVEESSRALKVSAEELGPDRVATPTRRSKVEPTAADRYLWQMTVGRSAQEKLEQARALLSHQVPSGDMAQVIERGLEALIEKLGKRKYAATLNPRTPRNVASAKPRFIPAHVRRAVRARDQGRCTFVGEGGHVCGTRKMLEFDHIEPVSRGGESTVENLRLRCRTHNQLEAERTLGPGLMHRKREGARVSARATPPAGETRQNQGEEQARARASAEEVIPWLRALGCRADVSRRAAAIVETIPDAPLEDRVRLAMTCLGPRAYSHTPAPNVQRSP